MKQIASLLILFFLNATYIFGQNDYYMTDSSITSGVTLVNNIDEINSSICQIMMGEKILELTPNQIAGYGFKNGRVYVSKEIQISDIITKKVFLERLVNGRTKLYYYKGSGIKTFFIENDSIPFSELSKGKDYYGNDFKDRLSKITNNCSKVKDALKLTHYNKKSLTNFIDRYNNCNSTQMTYTKFGVFLGSIQPKAYFNSMYSVQKLANFTIKRNLNFYFGAFVDVPISNNFSLNISVGYYNQPYSLTKELLYTKDRYKINFSSIQVPILFKYTLPKEKFRPYFTAGFDYSYNKIDLDYNSTPNDPADQLKSIRINKTINENLIGVVAGVGVQFQLNYRKVIFLETRYNQEISFTYLNKSSIELIMGFSF